MTFIDASTYYHIYDLGKAPTTYNVIIQLIMGELARETTTNCSRTHVFFLPGFEEDDYFNPIHEHYDSDTKKWRLGNIVLPAMDLFPSIASFSFLQDRREVEPILSAAPQNIFPFGYDIHNQATCGQSISPNLNAALGYKIPSIRAPRLAHEYVERIVKRVCGESKFITITLRQATYVTARNSSLEIWRAVSNFFRKHGYEVMVLPDYERVFDIEDNYFPGAYMCRECVLDLRLRFALYEQANLNLGQIGGPIACCPFNDKCNYVVTRFIVDGVGHSTQEFMQSMGYDVGKNNGYFDTFARWLWTEKDESNILDVCGEFIEDGQSTEARITSRVGSPTAAYEGVNSLFGLEAAKLVFSKLGPVGPVFINKELNETGVQEHVIQHRPSLES